MMEGLHARERIAQSLTSEIRQTQMSGGPGLDDTYDILLASHHEPKVIKHVQSFFSLGHFLKKIFSSKFLSRLDLLSKI